MVHMYLQTSDMLHVASCVCTLLQDGAYAVWQRMVKAGVVPDEVTQRILVHCFRNNLQMASALVKEARQLRVRFTAILSLQSCYHILQCVDPAQQAVDYVSFPMQKDVPLAQQNISHINAWCAYCIPPNKLLITIHFPCNRLCLWHNRTSVTSMPGVLIVYTPGGAFCTHQASDYLATLSVKCDVYT